MKKEQYEWFNDISADVCTTRHSDSVSFHSSDPVVGRCGFTLEMKPHHIPAVQELLQELIMLEALTTKTEALITQEDE